MIDCKRFTLLDLLNTIGEEKVQNLISSFSCPQNDEISAFIRNSAVNFAKRKITVTHFIFDAQRRLQAFFSLTHKPISILATELPQYVKRLFEKYAAYNPVTQRFEASGFLIAQLAKNYTYDATELSGDELIAIIMQILIPVQHEIGGRLVYLECDKNRPRLLQFYERNKFIPFKERVDRNDATVYVQMLRVL